MNRLRQTTAVLASWAVVVTCACGTPEPTGVLLVTSGVTDQIFVLDPTDGAVVDSLLLDRRLGERDEPHAVAVSPDGGHFYATLAHGEASLWKFETAGLRRVGRLTLDGYGASRVRLSPDGSVAAVPDYWLSGGGEVSRVAFVSTRDLELVAQPEICPAPHDAVFSPEGARIAVTCALGGEVLFLDAESYEVVRRVPTGEGSRPMNALWTPDGARVLATLMGSNAVVEIDSTGVLRRIPVGAGPAQLALTPEGAHLVVANRAGSSVSIVAVPAGTQVELPIAGANPHGVALSPDGATAYVTYEGRSDTYGGVVAVDVRARRVLWQTEVGQLTLGIAWLDGPGRN